MSWLDGNGRSNIRPLANRRDCPQYRPRRPKAASSVNYHGLSIPNTNSVILMVLAQRMSRSIGLYYRYGVSIVSRENTPRLISSGAQDPLETLPKQL